MPTPVALVPKDKRQAQDSIIAVLEATLAEAKDGKLLGLVIVAKDADGWVQRAAHNLNLQEEIGALEIIKAERIAQVLGTFADE